MLNLPQIAPIGFLKSTISAYQKQQKNFGVSKMQGGVTILVTCYLLLVYTPSPRNVLSIIWSDFPAQ